MTKGTKGTKWSIIFSSYVAQKLTGINLIFLGPLYLRQVFSALSERIETRGHRGLIFHDDNAKAHRACITNEFLLENHIEQYQNPAYSPDLSLCNFFLLPKLKKQLCGIRFNDDNEMLTALEQAIDSLMKNFKDCFEDRFIRMHKCFDTEGQYFEKIN